MHVLDFIASSVDFGNGLIKSDVEQLKKWCLNLLSSKNIPTVFQNLLFLRKYESKMLKQEHHRPPRSFVAVQIEH